MTIEKPARTICWFCQRPLADGLCDRCDREGTASLESSTWARACHGRDSTRPRDESSD